MQYLVCYELANKSSEVKRLEHNSIYIYSIAVVLQALKLNLVFDIDLGSYVWYGGSVDLTDR